MSAPAHLAILVAVISAALSIAPRSVLAESVRKTVCELSGHEKEFVGKEVIVDAEYIDFYHGKGITDRSCPHAIVFIWIDNPVYDHPDVDSFLAAWANRPIYHAIAAQFTGRIAPHTDKAITGKDATLLQLDLISVANWRYVPEPHIP